ncbi:MAG TPA: protealysin inhibitor emfourin [Myxococcales bacterium]
MKLILRKWGGFTGKAGAEVHECDLDSLPPAEAERLRKLVKDAQLDALPAKLTKESPQSWDFHHALTVIGDDGSERTVEFHEDAATPQLRAVASEVAQK